MAYIPVDPVIEHTTMEIYVDSSGEQRAYMIYPNEGYVLHDGSRDFELEDGTLVLGYTARRIPVSMHYDFEENPDQIYAVLESEVPADQIFGSATPSTTKE